MVAVEVPTERQARPPRRRPPATRLRRRRQQQQQLRQVSKHTQLICNPNKGDRDIQDDRQHDNNGMQTADTKGTQSRPDEMSLATRLAASICVGGKEFVGSPPNKSPLSLHCQPWLVCSTNDTTNTLSFLSLWLAGLNGPILPAPRQTQTGPTPDCSHLKDRLKWAAQPNSNKHINPDESHSSFCPGPSNFSVDVLLCCCCCCLISCELSLSR